MLEQTVNQYLVNILLLVTEWFSGREENDRRHYFIIKPHGNVGSGWDQTCDTWIYSQTRIYSQTCYGQHSGFRFVLFCFAALHPKSTAMVMAGRSVHLTTLFPGQA